MRSRAHSVTDEVVLVGNPNAGKSTLFNVLTGGHAAVGNWHGVTVSVLSKEATIGKTLVRVCDLPGVYSFDGLTLEEQNAVAFLRSHSDAFVLFVCECSALLRCLPLIGRLRKEGRRMALVLTKERRFLRAGGRYNRVAIAEALGVQVLSADGGRRTFGAELERALHLLPQQETLDREPVLPKEAYDPPAAVWTRADRLFCHPVFGAVFFLSLIAAVFYLVFAPGCAGDLLRTGAEALFSRLSRLAGGIASPVIRSLVADGIVAGVGGVVCFLPQILLLFFFLILLEESGLMSRLAALTDGMFSRVGLNGRAVFSLLMGFGCTAAAALTTQGLEDEKTRRKVLFSLPFLPCSAKLPVTLMLFSSFLKNPFPAVLIFYFAGALVCLFVASFVERRPAAPLVLELAPLQIPHPVFVFKSLLFQLKQFIIKLATVIFAFFLASWMLSSFDFSLRFCAAEESILATICGGLKILFVPIGCGDWRVAYAAFSGLIAKENIAGTFALFCGGFPFEAESAIAFSVFLLLCPPCVSAITAIARAIGAGRALLAALVGMAAALAASYSVYFLMQGGAWLVFPLPLIALLAPRNRHGRIRRNRTHLPFRLHRQGLRTGVVLFPHSAAGPRDPRERGKGRTGSASQKGGRRKILPHVCTGISFRFPHFVRGRQRRRGG